MNNQQIQIGSSWKGQPTVFLKLHGIKVDPKGGCYINLTPQTAAQVGKEILQLGEFCLKEFKGAAN